MRSLERCAAEVSAKAPCQGLAMSKGDDRLCRIKRLQISGVDERHSLDSPCGAFPAKSYVKDNDNSQPCLYQHGIPAVNSPNLIIFLR